MLRRYTLWKADKSPDGKSVLAMLGNEAADTLVDFFPLRQEIPAVDIVDVNVRIIEKQSLACWRNNQADFYIALKELNIRVRFLGNEDVHPGIGSAAGVEADKAMHLARDAPGLDVAESPGLEGLHVPHPTCILEIDIDLSAVTATEELLKVGLCRRLEIRKQSIHEDLRDRSSRPLTLVLQMRSGESEPVPVQEQADRSGIGREGRGREVVGISVRAAADRRRPGDYGEDRYRKEKYQRAHVLIRARLEVAGNIIKP